jgi:hypothetical protein
MLPSSGTCAWYRVLKMGGNKLLLVIHYFDSYFICSQVGENTRTVNEFSTAEDMCRVLRKVACC